MKKSVDSKLKELHAEVEFLQDIAKDLFPERLISALLRLDSKLSDLKSGITNLEKEIKQIKECIYENLV